MAHSEHKHTNRLAQESSPYLLQHAHNPVDWFPWSDEALAKAKKENKLILVSVGYSACHWCHVMEHESFEDSAVAKIMNDNFICIKVDREERPDIDQVYMTAVQLMTRQGGWPLNCFTLPDGRPIYGGTYFQKGTWIKILESLSSGYREDSSKYIEYAEKLTEGIIQSEVIEINSAPPQFTKTILDEMVSNWTKSFDSKEGGPNHAPKFPLPNNYDFLLQYGHLSADAEVLKHVELSLNKMAMGGIYDQIGGGFARYSTDVLWKVPHFEKMLYDNGQLIELYSSAYQKFKSPLYKRTVYQTIAFLERELTHENGAFYSALDADSEGEEGKFYVWTKEELEGLTGEDYEWVKSYYNVGKKGLWEHGNNILLMDESLEDFAKKLNLSNEEFEGRLNDINRTLLARRSKRIRPGLDDKTLTSWNAITIKGLAKAFEVFKDEKFLDMAIKNANFILQHQKKKDGGLFHNYKEGRSNINGYLEDYCFTIEAYLKLYEVTFNSKWLDEAKEMADYTIEHFYNPQNGMFYFTSDEDKALITRKMEVNDNVIPASNSSLAKGLFLLGKYFDNRAYENMAITMLNNMSSQFVGYPSGYSNWGILYLSQVHPFYEVAIVGQDWSAKSASFSEKYIPNKILLGSAKSSQIPLLQDKYVEGETYIYVCENKACQLPVTKVQDAIKQILK
ncbi:MAG: thioredoxin domain-containing protein [Flavobacteriales bacterium]|nr:thioredoxin domain-containing protein [Flavobacteriales bacterium]